MQQRELDIQPDSGSEIASLLFEQGEQYVRAGLLQQAEILLEQVWKLTANSDQQLADSAAWLLGWVLVHLGDYDQALSWFEKIVRDPHQRDHNWRVIASGAASLCRLAPRESALAPKPANAPALLEVVSLGSFSIMRDRRQLPVCRSRRAITIMRCLLAQPHRAISKERLVDLLWPEASPAQAAHSLHVAISALRSHLVADTSVSAVLYESGSYRLNPAVPIVDDASEFCRLCSDGDQHMIEADQHNARYAYERALEIYRGDYSVDESDPPCLLDERERLSNRYLLTLERLGQICADMGDHARAIARFQQLLGRDPYREDIFALLLKAYLHLGRRAEALRQYARFCTLLRQDLGLDASFELRRIRNMI